MADKLSKKKLLIGGGGLILALLGIYLFTIFNQGEEMSFDPDELDKSAVPQLFVSFSPQPEVYIGGVNLLNYSREEQRDILEAQAAQIREQEVKVVHQEQEFTKTLASLGLDLTQTIEEVLDEVEASKAGLSTLLEHRPFVLPALKELTFSASEEAISDWVQAIDGQLSFAPREPRVVGRPGDFRLQQGADGQKLAVELLQDDLHQLIEQSKFDDLSLMAQTEAIPPKSTLTEVPVMDTVISSATTFFPTGNHNRARNVRRATSTIDGSIVMPGEEFNISNVLGPVTAETGYYPAGAFVNGVLDHSIIGGGVSQVSSTLNWTVLRTGIVPTEAQPHSRRIDYMPAGVHATVWLPSTINFRFVNSLDYPIYIRATADNGALTFEFWSNSQALDGFTYDTRSEMVSQTSSREYWDVYVRKFRNGSFVSEEHLRRVGYNR